MILRHYARPIRQYMFLTHTDGLLCLQQWLYFHVHSFKLFIWFNLVKQEKMEH